MTDPLFLLDSNICIYLLGGLSEQARDRMQLCSPGEVVTSAVAHAEVMRGVDRSDDRAMSLAGQLFEIVEVMPFDRAAADAYALVPFRRGQFDRLIAAHALALDLPLVTNNEADFSGIPGLKAENWTLPLP